jgi:hypothetical protein
MAARITLTLTAQAALAELAEIRRCSETNAIEYALLLALDRARNITELDGDDDE